MQNEAAWTESNLTNPHAVGDKRARVQKMFSAIAPSYDLNNRLHSFWRDQAWRRKAVKIAELKSNDVVVDVACGTGDLTLAFYEGLIWQNTFEQKRLTSPANHQVIGIDFTYDMLPLAQEKSSLGRFHGHVGSLENFKALRRERGERIAFLNGDATALPLPDDSADVISIAFGIRNVQEPEKALKEFYRVLRPGGRVIVLEFSEPTNPVLRSLNRFYCGKIMPITATLISGDKSGAYKYLPKSIGTFWSREKMQQMLAAAGFKQIEQHPMTFGVCVCYRGIKA